MNISWDQGGPLGRDNQLETEGTGAVLSRAGDEEPPSLSMPRGKNRAVLSSGFGSGWERNWSATQDNGEREKKKEVPLIPVGSMVRGQSWICGQGLDSACQGWGVFEVFV